MNDQAPQSPVDAARARIEQIRRRKAELEGHSRLTGAQLLQLMSELDASRVSSRQQSGTKLSYVEAHDIKNMMIRIFGFGGYSSETLEAKLIREEQVPKSSGNGTNWKVTGFARVKVTIHGTRGFPDAVYTEAAVAGSAQPDFTESADMAIKSSESDAFKRAAIFLGTQFGLSLYANGSHSDQVQVIFEPVQRELLELERELARAMAYVAGQAAAQREAQQAAGEQPTQPTQAAQRPQSALQAGFNQGQPQ